MATEVAPGQIGRYARTITGFLVHLVLTVLMIVLLMAGYREIFAPPTSTRITKHQVYLPPSYKIIPGVSNVSGGFLDGGGVGFPQQELTIKEYKELESFFGERTHILTLVPGKKESRFEYYVQVQSQEEGYWVYKASVEIESPSWGLTLPLERWEIVWTLGYFEPKGWDVEESGLVIRREANTEDVSNFKGLLLFFSVMFYILGLKDWVDRQLLDPLFVRLGWKRRS